MDDELETYWMNWFDIDFICCLVHKYHWCFSPMSLNNWKEIKDISSVSMEQPGCNSNWEYIFYPNVTKIFIFICVCRMFGIFTRDGVVILISLDTHNQLGASISKYLISSIYWVTIQFFSLNISIRLSLNVFC